MQLWPLSHFRVATSDTEKLTVESVSTQMETQCSSLSGWPFSGLLLCGSSGRTFLLTFTRKTKIYLRGETK